MACHVDYGNDEPFIVEVRTVKLVTKDRWKSISTYNKSRKTYIWRKIYGILTNDQFWAFWHYEILYKYLWYFLWLQWMMLLLCITISRIFFRTVNVINKSKYTRYSSRGFITESFVFCDIKVKTNKLIYWII